MTPSVRPPPSGLKLGALGKHDGQIWALTIDSTGRHAISAAYDRKLMFWDLQTKRCVLAVAIDGSPTSIEIAPDNAHVVIGALAEISTVCA
jgi:WD40 repeat protein